MMKIGSLGLGALAAAALAASESTKLLGNELNDILPRRQRGKRVDPATMTVKHWEGHRLVKAPAYHLIDNAPNDRRAKVKAARKQNRQRQIAAKYA